MKTLVQFAAKLKGWFQKMKSHLPRFHNHKLQKFIAVYFVVCVLLTGCSDDPILAEPTSPNVEYSYTQEQILYSEIDAKVSFSAEMLHTETPFAKYYFEAKVDENQRINCIQATDTILAEIPNGDRKPAIYVFSENTYSEKNVMENALYIGISDWSGTDYAANVLVAAYGEGSHYGLAFGYANLLRERAGLETDSDSAVSIPAESLVLDLNLLCFDESFVSETEAATAKAIACDFVKYYTSTYGDAAFQDLLLSSKTHRGMEILQEVLSVYYLSHGVNYISTTLRFGYGGITYGYTVLTDYAKFYIGHSWKDVNQELNPLVSENFLHENYAETKEFFECNILQMESYQSLFDFDSYDNSLSVILPNTRSSSQYSYYQSGFHRIYLFNVDSFMHEYIHSLTKPTKTQAQWETEGFARYFSYLYDYYGIAFLNKDYNSVAETDSTRYVFEYKEKVQRPIDMKIDFQEIENIAVHSRGYTDPNASYVAGSSFVQYLINNYGEVAVIQSIYGGKDTLLKDFNELVIDWNQYISETYADYSKYK